MNCSLMRMVLIVRSFEQLSGSVSSNYQVRFVGFCSFIIPQNSTFRTPIFTGSGHTAL
jgi:hypothetical protein